MPQSRFRRFRTPLGLLLGLVLLDLVVIASADVWERHSPDDYALRVQGCARQQQDLVLLGGSVVSEGFIPGEFRGIVWNDRPVEKAYAVGLPGGTTSEFYHAIRRACPRPPRLLVYGITASDLNDSRHEPHGPASLMTFSDTITWARERSDSREWVLRQYGLARLSRFWSLWQYRHGIRMWAALQAHDWNPSIAPQEAQQANELRAYADALLTGDGYAPAAGFIHQRYDVVKAIGGTLPPFEFLNKYKTGSHRKYLKKIISWARENHVSLVLVDMPVTADLESKYADAFTEYRRVLREEEVANDLSVIRAHRDRVGITDAGFADTIHLNGVGATVMSRWLRAQLEQLDKSGTQEGTLVRAQVGGEQP